MGNVAAYRLTIDYTTEYPGKIVDDVAAGTIDLAIIWAPLAGYFAKKSAVPLQGVAVPPLAGVAAPAPASLRHLLQRGAGPFSA
jgi:mxaJ protein